MPEESGKRRHREVVDLLLEEGIITEEQLKNGREEAKRTGLNIEKTLEKLDFVNNEKIAEVRAKSLGIPYIDLTDYIIDKELIKIIPEHVAKKCKAVPLFKIGSSMTVGMVNPKDIVSLDNIRRVSRIDTIDPVLVSEAGLERILDSYGGAAASIDEIVNAIDKDKIADKKGKELSEIAEEAPVIKLVDLIIAQASKERASDIHIEPEQDNVRVRYRIDGILHETTNLPKKLQNAIISRIKVISNMDIAESRKPQDGRSFVKIEEKELDIRVSTFPTVYGENVVMRLLDKTSIVFGLKSLGMSDSDLERFDKLIRRPHGIILSTGPTGSGKTSTLYSALSTISTIEKNIITIEDPVEYELPLIRQTQVNPAAGITFSNGLRSILRQDPDVVMVGEIRDSETSDIAIRAALTGHLVFSTLHTNDAASALTRLTNMGMEPFLVSSSVIGILAQRLVRTICDRCKKDYSPDSKVLEKLRLPPDTKLYKGQGCNRCKGTGFVGRTGIFELLVINQDIRSMIESRVSADEIKKKAISCGMRTLINDGIKKAQKGITTIGEVARVT